MPRVSQFGMTPVQTWKVSLDVTNLDTYITIKKNTRSSTAHDLSTSVGTNRDDEDPASPQIISGGASHELNIYEQWMSFDRQRETTETAMFKHEEGASNPVHAL